jgi:hypothetical protein
MVDIILKLTKPEVEISTAIDTVHDSVLFRVFAPDTSKVTISDSANTVIGSMTIPAGFVEIIEKRPSDRVSAVPPVLCTPVAYK